MVYTIIGIVTLVVAIFFLVGVDALVNNFASSLLCKTFAGIRHSTENCPIGNVCMTDLWRLNPIVSFRAVPLIGCGSNDISFPFTDVDEISEKISFQLGDCWYKYGEGEQNVLWIRGENPAQCATIYADVGAGVQFTAEDLTYYLEHTNHSVVNRCLDNEEDCCDTVNGYECDENAPSQCTKPESNPWICETNTNFYQRCLDGFTPKDIDDDEACIAALKNFMCDNAFYYEDVCDESDCTDTIDNDGDTFIDETIGICLDAYGILPDRDPIDLGAYDRDQSMCKYCESSEGVIALPIPCTLRVTTGCTKEVTYAEFLGVGGKTVYSFKNSGGGLLVEPNDTTIPVTGKFSAYVYFVDSFTGTRKDAEKKYLPDWCATTSFLDSCSGCSSCLQIITTGGAIGLLARSSGVYKAAVYGTVGIIYDTVQYYVLGNPTTLTGIPSCLNCAASMLDSNNVDMLVCTDKMIVCVEDEPEV